MNRIFRRVSLGPAAAALAVLALVLGASGCGGGGGGGTGGTAAGADGTVLIGLTDADGDFVHYAVDIVSLRLVGANGDVVETLPATGRLDFAAYTELTELFSATAVPQGAYVAAEIMLDYATADVQVEVAGAAVPATIVGRDGTALGRESLQIRLDRERPLVVAPGQTSLVSIDFDLAASHEVDLAAGVPVVRAAPFLVAELAPVTAKELRVRGGVQSVNAAAGTYTVQLQPGQLRPARDFGAVTVQTGAATVFEIDGVPYIGGAGLAALAALPAGTPSVARGALTPAECRFDAATVLAGSSVPGASRDAVLGNVVARSGDTFRVRGATVVRPGGVVLYRDDVTVTLGAGTTVRRQPGDAVDSAAVSVGSRIEVLGTLTSAVGESPALDASEGRVRLLPTEVAGRVAAVQPGQLDLELLAIDRRPAGLFDFAGTGATPVTDADPAAYAVATAGLPLAGLEPGEPVRALGFVADFGAAAPDFAATTVVALRPAVARLDIGWRPGGTVAPFVVAGPDSLVLDAGNPAIGQRAILAIGPVRIPLADLPVAPAIVPPADGPTRYALRHGARVLVVRDFASFTAVVNRALGAGAVALGLAAEGSFDRDGNVLTARVLSMDLSRLAAVDE